MRFMQLQNNNRKRQTEGGIVRGQQVSSILMYYILQKGLISHYCLKSQTSSCGISAGTRQNRQVFDF